MKTSAPEQDKPAPQEAAKAPEKTGSGTFADPRKLQPRSSRIPADAPPMCEMRTKRPVQLPGNIFRCRGIPFEVTFPEAYQFEQHWGNQWLSLQYSPIGQVILLSVQAAPWTLFEHRWGKVDKYLPALLGSLKGLINPEIGEPETVQIPGAAYARQVGFSAGDTKVGTAGEHLSVVVKGWVMHLMVTGKKGHPLRRGGEFLKKILSSVKIVPRSAPMLHKFRSGMTVELPHDVWIMMDKDQHGRPNPSYMRASDVTFIQIIEAQSEKPCDKLTKKEWDDMIGALKNDPQQKGEINFGYSFWLDVGGIRTFWANAEITAQFPQELGRSHDPATATLMCHDQTLFQMFTIGKRATRRELQKMVEDVLTSLKAP
jgi:hypothetical protein